MIYELPSITTFFVIAHYVFRRRLSSDSERSILFPFIAIIGLALTVTTVGSPAFNLYGWGFAGWFPLVIAVLAALIARRAPSIAILALIAIIAFDLHLLRSRNLWDYVVDPWVMVFAWGWCGGAMIRRLKRGLRTED